MSGRSYRDDEGAYEVRIPEGWELERDGEGGVLIHRGESGGLLHLMPFERELGEVADPGEELYAFLDGQEIELEEDEVEDVELGGSGELAFCEYVEEEPEETVYWLVGVATGPGRLLFASYSCPAEEGESDEREEVKGILSSIRFAEPPSGDGRV